MNDKNIINEYLFYEFGLDIDEDETTISEGFPYELSLIGEFVVNNEKIKVYEFLHNGISNVVLYENGIAVYEKGQMKVEDLYFQKIGSS